MATLITSPEITRSDLSNLYVTAPQSGVKGPSGQDMGYIFENSRTLSYEEVNDKVIPLGNRILNAEKHGYDAELSKKRHSSAREYGAGGLIAASVGCVAGPILLPNIGEMFVVCSVGLAALSALLRASWQVDKLSMFHFNAKNLSFERAPPAPCADSRELDVELYGLTKEDPALITHCYEDTPAVWQNRYAAPAHTPQGCAA